MGDASVTPGVGGDQADKSRDEEHRYNGLNEAEVQRVSRNEQRRDRRCYRKENPDDPSKHSGFQFAGVQPAALKSSGDST